MNTRTLSIAAAGLVLALARGDAAAIAVPDAAVAVPRTGQSTCWSAAGAPIACAGTGQDGELQAGVPWPAPRFQDNGNGTLTDRLTGLTWLKDGGCVTDPVGFTMTSWTGALDGIAGFNANPTAYGCQDYTAAHADWRLPNLNEMASLLTFDASVTNVADWLLSQGFVRLNTGSPVYWTSSAALALSGGVYIVQLQAAFDQAWPTDWQTNFLPVRGGPVGAPDPTSPANVPATGQTATYHAGDDGALRWGVAWPNPRFRNNGDGTVTDFLTGLLWTRDTWTPGPAPCGQHTSKTWQGALAHVACLNTNAYLGYGDWRLPTVKELQSLHDISRLPTLPAGHPFLNIVPGGGGFAGTERWSSTSWAGDPSWAYKVDFWPGTFYPSGKTMEWAVWPVRSMRYGLLRWVEASTEGRCAEAYATPDYDVSDGTVGASVGSAVCAEGLASAPFTEEARALASGVIPFTVSSARTMYFKIAVNGVLGGDGSHEARIDVLASIRRWTPSGPETVHSQSVNATHTTTGILPVNHEEVFTFPAEALVDYSLEFEQTLSARATGAGSVASGDFLGTLDAEVSEAPFPTTTTSSTSTSTTTTSSTTTTTSTSTTTTSVTVETSTTSTSSTTTTSTTSTTSSTTTTLPPACGTAPAAGCRRPTEPGGGVLTIKDKLPDTKDVLSWKWAKGEATAEDDFGAPLATTGYVVCLWVDAAGTPSLALEATVPAGGVCPEKPCWKATKSGFSWAHKEGTPQGLVKLVLKAGEAGKAKITLKGKGEALSPPAPPLATPVVVQLRRSDAATCWEATFSTTKENEPESFKAKSD